LKDVTEATFNDIITPARVQFTIPIWQRTYSWESQQWNDLWGDLLDLYEKLSKGEHAQHFMGPIVLKTIEHKVGGITRLVIIDGQQRLTTLLLLCALIRDRAKAAGDTNLVKEIDGQILYNEFAKKVEDRPKLRPTEADRKFFDLIITGGTPTGSDTSQLHDAYRFFSSAFEERKDKVEIEAMLDCIRALKMVTIRLEDTDNPNRIFETLNFRGKDLAQSDLVRNFFMMSINAPTKADETYTQIWLPMQQALGTNTLERIENLEDYLRHYAVMRNQGFIKENKVYSEMRSRLKSASEGQIVSELKVIGQFSKFYERLLYAEREDDTELRRGISRLNRLKIGVHYPLLLKLYNGYSAGKISRDDFVAVLKTLESFIVRRTLLRMPTHSLNRFFAELCGLSIESFASSLRDIFASKQEWQAQYWPKDSDFKLAFHTLPIYKLSADRCRFVLETLEEDYKHPEQPNLENLWIEHVMPETLDESWKKYLGPNWKDTHDKYLHTIGNLTLIAASPDISIRNKLFLDKKKEWYSKSNVSLTRELNEKWNEWKGEQIIERASILANRAIKIWSRPE
jgi:uncharacterized protein with ParB-like and HNH nuclease domain